MTEAHDEPKKNMYVESVKLYALDHIICCKHAVVYDAHRISPMQAFGAQPTISGYPDSRGDNYAIF